MLINLGNALLQQNSSWLDAVATWAKLVVLAVSVLLALVGYKVHQELFKEGGIADRLTKRLDVVNEKAIRLEERVEDNDRRLTQLEEVVRWRKR